MTSRRPLPDPPLQLITGSWRDLADLEARVVAALRGGIRWVQLRAKERPARELYEAACRLAPLVRDAAGLFVVNDRIDVAIAAGAGGVHLPENGIRGTDARTLLGDGAGIAKSVHSVEAAGAAESLDAVQLGPIYETASKLAFGPPLGIDRLRLASRGTGGEAPRVIAVGGITGARIGSCLDAGASAVSIIGSIWTAADVETAARAALTGVGRNRASNRLRTSE
jgi:thiamine-phosphate pyrophosphorylase